MKHHYLVLVWAEDGKGMGTFSPELDYSVSHPHDCVMERDEVTNSWVYTCGIQFDIDNVGSDAFDRTFRERPTKPGCWPIEWWVDTYHVDNGSHYGEEVSTGISIVEEENS